jgi:hypothetical protein
MFDAWYLKLAQTWDRLTTSEAAKASKTRCQAVAAKMASDVFAQAQRKAREEKPEVRPPSEEGSPPAGDATSWP